MKTPTWAYIVGILMMLLGGCSTIKNCQLILTPVLLENQKAMMKGLVPMVSVRVDTTTQTLGDSSITVIEKTRSPLGNKEMIQNMEKMFYMSDFQKTWIVRLGYIGFIPSLIYIVGGLFLLIKRRFSIKLACSALILSALFSVIRTVVLLKDASIGFIAMSSSFGMIFGVIMDVILLIIILASDRSYYLPRQEVANSSQYGD
ncbi:MAG: hypothetical protein JST76_08640 [Bacteroidetes bacterium]|nr:hypothetical protein [Bacteroidota bacterium]MBS1618572.1 hypothetical protein [Bacteroidota bacterium]